MFTAIDLFAGLGGWSTGARDAGAQVLWAANHWPAAVEWHTANHPETQHICQDLHQADWSQVPKHDLMLASPCCQGHTKACGRNNSNPKHDNSRSTAWSPVSNAEVNRPEFAIIENVPEFMDWVLYPAWAYAMQRLGYLPEHLQVHAVRFTIRVRAIKQAGFVDTHALRQRGTAARLHFAMQGPFEFFHCENLSSSRVAVRHYFHDDLLTKTNHGKLHDRPIGTPR